tara:strand:- start:860 stop:1855 length:996 start_codon:yes stop_codon:yes gene_type:complete
MTEDLISIVLPCYNGEKFIETSIGSIQQQSHQEFELIVIDDGSTDDSFLICKNLAEKDPRIRLIKNDRNQGLIYTLNKGISLANGIYIARMDADDLSHPKRLEKQLHYLKEHPEIDILGTDVKVIDQKDNHIKSSSKICFSPSAIKFSAYFAQPLVHGSILAKSAVLKKHNYAAEYIHCEDYELWLRLLSKGHKIANLDSKLYFYRVNSESVSNKNEDVQISCHNKVSHLYLNDQIEEVFDMPTVAILNNRPLQSINKVDLKKSLLLFKDLFQRTAADKELKKFYHLHMVDICIQSIKQIKGIELTFYAYLLLIRSVFNVHAFRYFIEKLI